MFTFPIGLINPKTQDCFNFYRANDQGYIDFGLIPSTDFQNVRFEFDLRIPATTGDYNWIVAWNVKLATSGILIYLSNNNNFVVSIYNGTGMVVATQSWSGEAGNVIHCKVDYSEVGVRIESDLFPTVNAAYQVVTYPDATRKTNFGKISGYNLISTKLELWNVVVTELNSLGGVVAVVGDWKLNGDANDSSGNGNDGSLINWLPENWGSSCE